MFVRYVSRFTPLMVIGLLIISSFILQSAPNPAQAATSLAMVTASADDADERTDTGAVTIDGSNLRFGKSTGQTYHVGLRFTGVVIPAGATIISASTTFVSAGADSGDFIGRFWGEANTAPVAFTATAYDISSRVTTTASVTAGSAEFGPWANATNYQSPELASVIQELVDSYDYSTGGNIVLIWEYVSGNGKRLAYSIDGGGGPNAPALSIVYEIPYFAGATKVDSDADNTVVPGQTITYTITIPNTAGPAFNGVTIEDVLEDKVGAPYNVSSTNCGTPNLSFTSPTATFSNIDIGAASTCILQYDVDVDAPYVSDTPESDTIDNAATITPAYGSGILNADSLSIDVAPNLSTSVKTDDDGDNNVDLGQTVTYTLTLNNTGDGTGTGIDVSDVMDTDLENLSISSLTDCGTGYTDNSIADPPEVDITDVLVNPGTACTIVFTANVSSTVLDETTIANTASIGAADEGGAGATPSSDTLTVTAEPDISTATKEEDEADDVVSPGNYVMYTITIPNTGYATATGMQVTDTIDAGYGMPHNFSFTDCENFYNNSDANIDIQNVAVAPGHTCVITYDVMVDNPYFDNGTLENACNISAPAEGGSGVGPLAATTLTVDITPYLGTSTKTDNDADNNVGQGQTVAYTITIINSGDGTGTGIDVSDVLDTHMENLSVTGITNCGSSYTDNSVANPPEIDITGLEAVPGTSCVITFTADVSAGTPDSTVINNTAAITGADEGGSGAAPSSDALTVQTEPNISTSSKGENDADNAVTPGQTVTYTVFIVNTGSATGTGIDLTDTIDPGFGAPHTINMTGCGSSYVDHSTANVNIQDLEVGPGETCYVVYEVDVDNPYLGDGTLDNSAALSAPAEGGSGVASMSAATLTVDSTPNLSTSVKTENDSDDTVSPGQTVTYTVTINNTGDGLATGVSVSETLDANLTDLSVVNNFPNCGLAVIDTSIANPPQLNITNLQITPLTACVITYTAKVSSSATNGTVINNTATISAANEGGAGASPSSSPLTVYVAPPAPTQTGGGGFVCPNLYGSVFSINNNASQTDSQQVTLTFTYDPFAVNQVIVSEDPAFVGASYHLIAQQMTYVLSPDAGAKTLYVRFMNACSYSTVLSKQITLTASGTMQPTGAPAPVQTQTPAAPACELTCADLILDPYLVNPDGTERHAASAYVQRLDLGGGIYQYRYEDKGSDMDFNDVVVNINAMNCRQIGIERVSLDAGWHHQLKLRMNYKGAQKDVLMWTDTHAAAPVTVDAMSYAELCAPATGTTPAAPAETTCGSETTFVSYLSIGARSEEVRALQQLLQCLGYFPADVSPTGYFGPITETAVRAFQRAKGIDPLGVVGPLTRAALNVY